MKVKMVYMQHLVLQTGLFILLFIERDLFFSFAFERTIITVSLYCSKKVNCKLSLKSEWLIVSIKVNYNEFLF